MVGTTSDTFTPSEIVAARGSDLLLGVPVHSYAFHSDHIYNTLDCIHGGNVAASGDPKDHDVFNTALTTRRKYLQGILSPRNPGEILALDEALPALEELYVLTHIHGRKVERHAGYDPTSIMKVAIGGYLLGVNNHEGDVKTAAVEIQKLVGRSFSIEDKIPPMEKGRLEVKTATGFVHRQYREGMGPAIETNDIVKMSIYQNPTERFTERRLPN